jgi:hypothetical protein
MPLFPPVSKNCPLHVRRPRRNGCVEFRFAGGKPFDEQFCILRERDDFLALLFSSFAADFCFGCYSCGYSDSARS